jgi:NADP-dependent 3-hydroxy acid dehydrogenase YdfG
MNRLSGKVALVTGGGSGIGLAVARTFLSEGARVGILGRDEQKLKRAAAMLDAGDRLVCLGCDISQEEQVSRAVDEIVDRLGTVNILVNNAGVNVKKRGFRELTGENWRLMLRTNLDGAFYVTRAVLPAMAEQREGIVVFVSSIAGRTVFPLSGAGYSASKFGLSSLGLCLAAEEKDNGIRVTVIYPGEVDTPILDQRPVPLTPEQRQAILQPEDVAAAVLFVATLPKRASVPELAIMPSRQRYL